MGKSLKHYLQFWEKGQTHDAYTFGLSLLLKVKDADELKWLELSADFFNYLNSNEELVNFVVETNLNSKWKLIEEKLQ